MSESNNRLSRRHFLHNTALVAGAGVIVVAGAGVAIASQQPQIDFLQTSFGEGVSMTKKILVAYASKCGSTGEIAQVIGEVINQAGLSVDVRRVQDIKDLSGYQALVLGSAARMGKLLPEALKFAEKNRSQISQLPTAYFTAGAAMITDKRQEASSYLDPLCQVREPFSKGLFAGKVDHTKMEFPLNLIMSMVKEGEMADGDHRNWEAIRGWAVEVANTLAS